MSSFTSFEEAGGEDGKLIHKTSAIVFHFWNGDTYEGEFNNEKTLVREGRGIYKTADGEVYEGIWENDILKVGTISYPNKCMFAGNLEEMIMQGLGRYRYDDTFELQGMFDNNELVGDAFLVDPCKNVWKATVEKGDPKCTFYPVNMFWQSVVDLPPKTIIMNDELEGEYNELI